MRLFGLEVTRRKAAVSAAAPGSLSPVDGRGWYSLLDWLPSRPEWAFQRDIEVNHDSVLAQSTVFACITLIASDLAKLDLLLMEQAGEIWRRTDSPAFSPVLAKPNSYQTRQQFIESWAISKLSTGNAVVLKERDGRGVVTALHVLDWVRARPLVSESGDVYYALQEDNLARVGEYLEAVPASEIIHDRWNCLFHPLVGLSPIFASGLAATQALRIQQNSTRFFQNASRPGGVLTAPAQIKDETARRIKEYWEQNFRGENSGKIAVLGDGLTYAPMAVTPVDAQLVEQLKISSEQICSTFHVPAYMVGVGPAPTYNNIEALTQHYYDRCLQSLIEAIEACLDLGLGIGPSRLIEGRRLRTQLDLKDLLRMDTPARVKALNDGVNGGWMKPNEARAEMGLEPVPGGETPYLQQQYYALAALKKRDDSPDPFKSAAPAPAPAAEPAPPPDAAAADEAAKAAALAQTKEFVAEMTRLFDEESARG